MRKIGQYFHPQRQTQLMNEGWACFWHYTLLNALYDEGLLSDGFMLEFLQAHTNVVYQPPYNSNYYNGINPYALGFALWRDLRRVCTNPTEEDRAWFPEIAGSDWRTTFEFAMRNFKDESFVGQYLSPQLMREFRLFAVLDDDRERRLKVEAIHDETGYRAVRSLLSEQYDLSHREPNIQVWSANVHGDRTLTLRHYLHRRRPLADNRDELLRHVAALWGFPVQLEEEDESGLVRPVSLIHVDRRRAVD